MTQSIRSLAEKLLSASAFGLLSVFVLVSSAGATAASPPAALWEANVSGICPPQNQNCFTIFAPGSISNTFPNGLGRNASTSATLSEIHGGSISASSSDGAAANGQFTIFGVLNGPQLGQPIPIDVLYTLSITSRNISGGANVSAFVQIDYFGNCVNGESSGIFGRAGVPCARRLNNNVDGKQTATGFVGDNVAVSEPFTISGRVFAAAGGGDSVAGSVDPWAFIDPSFALVDPNYLSDFTLSLSPGVGNSVGVPEPITGSLVGVGFAGMIAMRRRLRTAR